MTTKINVSQSGAGEPTTAIPTFKGELYLNETDGSIWRAYGLSAGNWYLLTDSNNEFSGSYDDLSDKPTIPVKATGAEIDAKTEDSKFATAKALADQTVLEKTANKKTNLTDNSDTYYPTQKAVKTAVDAKADKVSTTTVESSATPTPTGGSKENEYYLTALVANATFAAPSGTPANGNTLVIRIKPGNADKVTATEIVAGGTGYTAGNLVVDNTGTNGTGFAGTYTVSSGVIDSITITNAGSGYTSAPAISGDAGGAGADLTAFLGKYSLSWNAIYESTMETLPTTTVAGKTMYLGFVYDSAKTKWSLLSLLEE